MSNRNIFLIALLLGAAALRVSGVLPFNFSPVAAIALFGGVMFGNRMAAFAVPLGIMLISDMFIGFHSTMWAVYLGLLAVVMIGRSLSGRKGIMLPMVGAVAGSVIFFLLTNAAVWMSGGLYSPGISGLFESYAAGLPFFRNSLMGDLIFTIALFGTYELTRRQVPVLVRV